MDIFEALYTRRSIRKYSDEAVGEADLRAILKAAMMAPSARNEQPWHFVIARDAELREKLSRISPYTGMAARAPLVILVCGDKDLEKAPGMWQQDCAAALENIMLAARGKNLGSVWCGIHPVGEREAEARRVLDLPANIIPFGLVCLGYPEGGDKEFREAEGRFLENRVHFEGWWKK